MFLKKWELNFDPNTQSITSIPIWIRLPKLLLQYWHDEVLAGIGNWIRDLISIHKAIRAKSLMIFAYNYVNIYPTTDLLKSIEMIFNIGDWN